MASKRARIVYYVGLSRGIRQVFGMAQHRDEPTSESHLPYAAAIGPFRTRRGAEFMATYGKNNPHCHTVADAERLAKAK